MSLTNKRIAFVEHYLGCWNASKAARLAGYKQAHSQGPRLLGNVDIQVYIQTRLTDVSMGTDEVLTRLTEIARGDSRDTIKALELLGKHHKLFTERHEVDATHAVSDDILDAIGGALGRGYGSEDSDEIE